MANTEKNCFVCNQAPEAPADPELISGGSRGRRTANLFNLLQRVLDLDDISADQSESELVHQIPFCKSCLDELEVTGDLLGAFDILKKMTDRHKKQIKTKFLESKRQERQSRDVELDRVAKLRSEMVAAAAAGLRSTAMTDSSTTPGLFKRVTRTRTKPEHFSGQALSTIPSTSQRISPLQQHSQIPRSCEDSLGIRNDDSFELNEEEDGEFTFEQTLTAPPLTNNLSSSANLKKKEVLNDPSNSNQHLSSDKMKLSKSPSILRNKAQTRNKPIEKKHKCPQCPAKFNQKWNLNQHLQIHTGEKPFSCKLCPKTFSQNSHLNVHQLVHGGEKAFHCKSCSKTFAGSSKLKEHERVHTGEKPYICKMCLRAFALSGDLVCHMRTHTGEKPYKCTVCAKDFARSHHLKRHLKTHKSSE